MGLIRLLSGLEVGAWLLLGSFVLLALAPDCPLRLPLSLSPCLGSRGCRVQSERASRGAPQPRAGNGAPELQRRLAHPAQCGRWGPLPLQLPPAAAGPPPSCLEAPGSENPMRRRHLAERRGRGRRGAAAGGTPWGSCRTPGEAPGPYGGHGDVQVEGKPQS